MRILVCSDSHGRGAKLLLAAKQQPTAEIIVFLGDGEAESEYLLRLPGKTVHRVCGNCDFGSQLPGWELFTAQGKRVLCTHGHLAQVKWGLASLRDTAHERGVQLALFGHTHTPLLAYEDGVYLFNPGSVAEGSFGFVDITPAGVVCVHCRLPGYSI
ncbi:MAG: YfcE family phosphodiesterase [Oscillospiraceae bacterium]|jgi:putative phosphoesterase|nr:YfcE family phosphodiesterase [Oscillospiraceae bacterium]